MSYSSLISEANEKIAVITLNRPEKLSCLDHTGWKELRKALKEGDDRPDVKVQIITGAGRAFCAGDDISLLTQVRDVDLPDQDRQRGFTHGGFRGRSGCVYGEKAPTFQGSAERRQKYAGLQ
jgi:enoyl-CoA hydratase/carnithine racemase